MYFKSDREHYSLGDYKPSEINLGPLFKTKEQEEEYRQACKRFIASLHRKNQQEGKDM